MIHIFKESNRRFLVLLSVFLIAIGLLAVFGDKGLIEAYELKQERDGIIRYNSRLTEDNRALSEDIHLLKTDMRHVAMIARKDLGMIGKDEVIYMFDE